MLTDIFTNFREVFAAASPLPASPRRPHVHEPREDIDWTGDGRVSPIATCRCGAEAAFRCRICAEWVFEDDPSPDVETCNPCHLQLAANQRIDDDLDACQREMDEMDAEVKASKEAA